MIPSSTIIVFPLSPLSNNVERLPYLISICWKREWILELRVAEVKKDEAEDEGWVAKVRCDSSCR